MSDIKALIARVEKIVLRELSRMERLRDLNFPMTDDDHKNLERFTKQLIAIESFKTAQNIINNNADLETLSDAELQKRALEVLKVGGF